MNAVDSKYKGEMTAAQGAPGEIDDSTFPNDDVRARSSNLFAVLASMCTEKALKEVNKIKSGSGNEAWRKLCAKYEPQIGTRAISVLQQILNPEFPAEVDKFEEALADWEELVYQYESQNNKSLGDDTKVAVIRPRCPI